MQPQPHGCREISKPLKNRLKMTNARRNGRVLPGVVVLSALTGTELRAEILLLGCFGRGSRHRLGFGRGGGRHQDTTRGRGADTAAADGTNTAVAGSTDAAVAAVARFAEATTEQTTAAAMARATDTAMTGTARAAMAAGHNNTAAATVAAVAASSTEGQIISACRQRHHENHRVHRVCPSRTGLWNNPSVPPIRTWVNPRHPLSCGGITAVPCSECVNPGRTEKFMSDWGSA